MSAAENFNSELSRADEQKKLGDQFLQAGDIQKAKISHLSAIACYLACLQEIDRYKSGISKEHSSYGVYPLDAREKIITNMLDILKRYKHSDSANQKKIDGLIQDEKVSNILGNVNLISAFLLVILIVAFILIALLALMTGAFIVPLIVVSCVLAAAIALNAITSYYLSAFESRMARTLPSITFNDEALLLTKKGCQIAVELAPLVASSLIATTPTLPSVADHSNGSAPTQSQENQGDKTTPPSVKSV